MDFVTCFGFVEKRMEAMAMAATRDVGTQSTPHELSSSSLSPASTPSIIERSLKRCEVEAGDSPSSNAKVKSQEQVRNCNTNIIYSFNYSRCFFEK